MRPTGPVKTDIVLVGGGHAHVQVMMRLAMAREPGVRVTLISEALEAPYSGMLPGYVAGVYGRDDIHIDLARLAFASGTRMIQARAIGLDRANRRVLLEGRPPVAYDAVSLNVGILPDLSNIAGAAEHATPVKPIAGFLARFNALLASADEAAGPRSVTVVGGGAAGVELAMALRARLRRVAAERGLVQDAFTIRLVTSATLVPGLNDGVRRRVREALAQRAIAVHEGRRVVGISAEEVMLDSGETLPSDAVIVSTKARAPGWLAELGLPTAPDGALLISPTLQTIGDPSVFAVGDCATLQNDPAEKAGVFAVRQGPVLARNLLRVARKQALRPWRRQREFLVLLNTGDGEAIGGRGRHLAVQGRWVWRWKNFIDRRFMAMFARFNRLPPVQPDASGEIPAEFRCGGCAAKVGPGPLGRALRRLPPAPATAFTARLIAGLDAPDDAAAFTAGAGRLEFETIDLVRAFIDDPYRFGEIAALHALSDIYAMGGTPTRALALAVLPHGRPETVAEDLFQLLAGARAALDREGVALVGGHSSEGDAMALGFAVTGEGETQHLTRKGGARPGDSLILTKALGTGVIFAAAMRGAAPAGAIAAALQSQARSNRAAAEILARHGATAVTDVTGFGLMGHLSEMLQASGVSAAIDSAEAPLLEGAKALAEAGYVSSLTSQNTDALADVVEGAGSTVSRALLFDPQTSGGLLAAVPPDEVKACLAALHLAGIAAAARIGGIQAGPGPSAPLITVH